MFTVVADSESIPVTNVYCIGRNYAEHAAELQNEVPSEPMVFLKSTASLRSFAASPMAFAEEEFHHEAELVLLIGQGFAMNSRPGLAAVAAVTLGLDLTRRRKQAELKAQGHPWTLAKSFAGSAVVGPFVPRAKLNHVEFFQFELRVNGSVRQVGDSRDMLFPIPYLIDYLNSFQSLERGDLIFTGTPAGVGPIRKGDALELILHGEDLVMTGEL